MDKIKMLVPIVEMDGDEMTRILWQMIKEHLILPFIDLKTEYFDLGLVNRDQTEDQITLEAAEAIKKYHVGVKCATITPNDARMEEYHLKKMYKSPNGTIRAALDGTVFRTPIIVPGITPYVRTWEAPITIARHAYGDIYKAADVRIPKGSSVELLIKNEDGTEAHEKIYDFECDGVVQGLFNKDSSIQSFAKACFEYALSNKQDLWFAAKDTISKKYDGVFRDIFQDMYDNQYKALFDDAGIRYAYTLIDDAIARVMRSKGGFVWACKNYDGDVMSDMVSSAFGSLAMMKSVLVSPDGNFEFEAAHGTITRHYRRYLSGEQPSSNPVATIFAWSGALRQRGIFDANQDLIHFADCLESACLEVIDNGIMTGDIAIMMDREVFPSTSEEYLMAVQSTLKKTLDTEE